MLNEALYIRRDPLATACMTIWGSGAGWQLLSQRRRMGKTQFMLNELTDAAEKAKWRVRYFSFFVEGQTRPNAVREFLTDLADFETSGRNLAGRVAEAAKAAVGPVKVKGKIKAKALGHAGFGHLAADAELEATATIKPPARDSVLEIVAALAAQPTTTLLLLDEIQALDKARFHPFLKELRTALDKHQDKVKVLFTGSSMLGLQKMFGSSKAIFYLSTMPLPFKPFGREFTDKLATGFEKMTGRKIDRERLFAVHESMGGVTEFTRKLVDALVLDPEATFEAKLKEYRAHLRKDPEYRKKWESLTGEQQSLLRVVAKGKPDSGASIYEEDALAEISALAGVKFDSSKAQGVFRTLENRDILLSYERKVAFHDDIFREWVSESADR